MSQANENTNAATTFKLSRNEDSVLVITLYGDVTSEAFLKEYEAFNTGENQRDDGFIWDGIECELSLNDVIVDNPDNYTCDFSIQMPEKLEGDALDQKIIELDSMLSNFQEEQTTPKVEQQTEARVDIVLDSVTQIPAEPKTLKTVPTVIEQKHSTKITSNSGPTKIGKEAPSPLANTVALDRLVKEGIGSRSAPTPRHRSFAKVENTKEVPHTKRGKELLDKAMQQLSKETTDGEGYINFSRFAKTKLGKLLNINALSPFTLHSAGDFASVGAFWVYLLAENPTDELRDLHGFECHKARSLCGKRRIDGFNLLIAEATWAKVCCNSELYKLIEENELPYRYVTQDGHNSYVDRTGDMSTQLVVINEISNTIKRIKETGNPDLRPNLAGVVKDYDNRPKSPKQFTQPRNNPQGYVKTGKRQYQE